MMMNAPLLPTINASLNLTAALLLFLGWRAIKSGARERHKKLMVSAVAASAAFLCCYLYYHYTKPAPTQFAGPANLKPVYLLVLIPHIILAAGMVPFILGILFLAWKQKFEQHRRIARWVWPAWMYVSVTGVLVYLMLYVIWPQA